MTMIGDPMTGRDSEMEVIRRALSGVGHKSGAVIVGSAGVGKTRLAREVLSRAEASGERHRPRKRCRHCIDSRPHRLRGLGHVP